MLASGEETLPTVLHGGVGPAASFIPQGEQFADRYLHHFVRWGNSWGLEIGSEILQRLGPKTPKIHGDIMGSL